MKLIEAMKRLRLIEKKMDGNCSDITRYSSIVSTERAYFDSETEQKREVIGLVQSNVDLMNEYLKLKRSIEYTNLTVTVSMGETKYTISDLLVLKRKLAKKMQETFASMNDSGAERRMRNVSSTGDKPPQVIRLYDEKVRNEGLRAWSDLYYEIDSRLEVINATTDLHELSQVG